METPSALTEDIGSELTRRHKTTATTFVWLLVAVVLLSVLAFVMQKFLTPGKNSWLDVPVRIIIVVFFMGAVALRRTQFAKMRLQDIAALQGASGLLITLQRTTLRVAMIGILIAAVGFVATLMTGIALYTYLAGVAAVVVLVYSYPIRTAWETALRRFPPDNGPNSAKNLS